MGLSNSKEDQLRKQPIIESFVRMSEDGKYVVHKTVITDIKPVAYVHKVLAGPAEKDNDLRAEMIEA